MNPPRPGDATAPSRHPEISSSIPTSHPSPTSRPSSVVASGEERRFPPREAPSYPLLAALSAWLEREARAAADIHGGYHLLDVGCGDKPYQPFFARYASAYVGLDPENPAAELRGTAEEIPVADGSFEVVLCTQVLEHVNDPACAVRELRRVTAPGGRVLVSTHGVVPFHPSPEDHWRWTHAGLERLFRDNGDWEHITVTPACGATATLGMLFSWYVDLLAKDLSVRPLAGRLIRVIHAACAAIDRRSSRLREPVPGSLHANFHLEADVRA